MAAEVTHTKVSAIPDDPVAEAAGEILPSDWNDGHVVTGVALSSHAHAGEDITSGTVADARVAAALARDSEVTTAVGAEATARDAAIATHAGLSDPHPGYLTPAEGNAAYDAAGAAAAVSAAAVLDGDTAGGQLTGTYPNPSVAASHSGSAHHDPVTVGTGLDLTGQLIDLDLSEVAAGGELGGFMDAPTVDATHSGSTHAAAQAAAEATAAADVDAHEAASDPHAGYRLESADHSHASTGAQGGTVAHSALTSVSADQHHAQTHATAHQPSGADAMSVDAAQATGSLRTITTSAAQAVGTAAAGNGTAAAASNHVHSTGAGTPSTQAFGDAAATGSGPAAAMTDHKHAMPANPATAGVAILLTYDLASDIANQAITAGTYFDMIANQNFTVVGGTGSVIEIVVRGLCFFNDNQANEYMTRINIDSAGTPILRYIGAALNAYPTPTLNSRNNPLVGGSIFITGLAAGVHTIKVQITTSSNNDHLYCRASTVGPPTAGGEFLQVQVIEHKN